jgi:hypothetical protein
MPRGKREQADQIILKLREAELELSRGKTVPEAARRRPSRWGASPMRRAIARSVVPGVHDARDGLVTARDGTG